MKMEGKMNVKKAVRLDKRIEKYKDRVIRVKALIKKYEYLIDIDEKAKKKIMKKLSTEELAEFGSLRGYDKAL